MNLKALQTLRRSVFGVYASAVLFPLAEEIARPETPVDDNSRVIIGTAFLADDSGVFITAGHVVQKLLERARTMEPRFEAGEIPAQQRRPLLVAQLQYFPDAARPADARGDGSRRVAIGSTSTAATSYLLDERHDLAALFTVAWPKRHELGDFAPVPLAFAAGEAALGDEVVTCGYPYGDRLNRVNGLLVGSPPTLSRGIVGAILPEWSAPPAMRRVFRYDATTLPGNSGGPVCDARSGKLVGVASTVAVHRVQHLDHHSQRDQSAVPVGFPQAVPLLHTRNFLAHAKESRAEALDFVTGLRTESA